MMISQPSQKDLELLQLLKSSDPPKDRLEQIKRLIKEGANVNCQDKDGFSPLHLACFFINGDPEMVKLLLKEGADPNFADKGGDTPLHTAAINGFKEIYDYLVDKDADPNIKNDDKETPAFLLEKNRPLRQANSGGGVKQFGAALAAKGAVLENAQPLFVQTNSPLPPLPPVPPVAVPAALGVQERPEDEFKDILNRPKAVLSQHRQGARLAAAQEEKQVNTKKLSSGVKVEQENNGQKVTVQFSYSRSRLLGTNAFGGHLKGGSSAAEVKELRAQTKEAVAFAIKECNKGSQENPINIQYTNPRYPQPEAALAILMEYKKQAMESGRPFYAKNAQGELVEISPITAFSEKESALFNSFASAVPVVRGIKGIEKPAGGSAGYKLFKDVKDSYGEAVIKKSEYKEAPKEEKQFSVMEAMQQYLINEAKALSEKSEKKVKMT